MACNRHSQAALQRVSNRNNASDMESQWYYRMLRDTYPLHVVAQFALLYALFGLDGVVSTWHVARSQQGLHVSVLLYSLFVGRPWRRCSVLGGALL